MKGDTFVCLGDVGAPEYVKEIKARKKILILGNHDAKGAYTKYFDEIYAGPIFIAEKILLSHEPRITMDGAVERKKHREERERL